MSQLEQLNRGPDVVALNGPLAMKTIDALCNEFSMRILVCTLYEAKTVQEVSEEQVVPLSSCYRLVRRLAADGLLMVERIVVTPEGRRYGVYRNAFKTIEVTSDFDETSVIVELNPGVAEKFHRRLLDLPRSH